MGGSCRDLDCILGGLLSAEAARIGVAGPDFVMSDRLTVNDGGLDAVVRNVPAAAEQGSAFLPEGQMGLQIKATHLKYPSAFDLADELRKPWS